MIDKHIFDRYSHRIEIHAHTSPASACAQFKPELVVRKYAALGFDGIVITNHFSVRTVHEGENIVTASARWLSDFYRAEQAGRDFGIKVYFGMEMCFAGKRNDYLYIGASPEDTETLLSYMSGSLRDFRENYHDPEALLVFAHPCRDGISDIDLSLVDAVEIMNFHPAHNSRVGLAAARYGQTGLALTGGTDFHDPGSEGLCFMRFPSVPADGKALAAAIRSRDYIIGCGDTVIIP